MNRLPLCASFCLLASPVMAQTATVSPGSLEFVFEEIVTLGPAIPAGMSPYGKRNIIPITGGTFKGPQLSGTIIPGGWDWQLMRTDGCTDIKADYMLRTDDGAVINIVNAGTLCPSSSDNPSSKAWTQPRFEAPLGKFDWLNKATFVGTLEGADKSHGPAVKITIYRVR